MFQEECRAQVLGEHIGYVLRSGNGKDFNMAFLDLFSDVMIADLNMLNPLVGAIYIMYSRQLPWGILISYRK